MSDDTKIKLGGSGILLFGLAGMLMSLSGNDAVRELDSLALLGMFGSCLYMLWAIK